MYLCDTHSHTLISPDSHASLLNMAWAAVHAGLQEFCVTDHCDLLDQDGDPVTTFNWSFAIDQYLTVKERLGTRMSLLHLGLELGSAPYDPAVARAILKEGEDWLDFVLGSLHNWIGEEGGIDLYGTDFTGRPDLCRKAVEHTLDHTWTLVTKCPDCYDSLAHINYPLRYIHRDGIDLSLDDYEDRVRAIFTEIAKTDHALEVNTHHGTDLDSWFTLLRWYKECGGELVTVGSDAHRPEDVAKGIPEALELLQAAGFRYVTTFYERKPVTHSLYKYLFQ